MKLLVTITFHYNLDKFQFFLKTLKAIANIKTEYTKVIVCTNKKFDIDIDNLNIELDIIERLYHPFFLAWCHKRHMLSFLESDYTHFVYIEDDIEITQQCLEYWTKTIKLFRQHDLNFIPGLIRIEYDDNGKIFAVDPYRASYISSRPSITIEDQTFISPEAPYSASYIMDKILVREHMMSLSSRYETATPFYGVWLVQDLAAQGNMYENIPNGFEHRILIPLKNTMDYCVHHNTDTYVNLPDNRHGKVPIECMFI